MGLILTARHAGSTQASSPAPSITADVTAIQGERHDVVCRPAGRSTPQRNEEQHKTMVEKIGQPGIVWEPSALKRHARQLERNYYLCEALIGLLGMSVIGVWRARRTMSGVVGTAT